MKSYVLDSSVVVKWFSGYDEADIENALRIRDEILEGSCTITVLDLLFYEIANALRYNTNIFEQDVIEAIKSIFEMGFDVKTVDEDLLSNAIKIAFSYNVSIYDSCFLALAKITGKQFITADYKFAERIKSFPMLTKLSEL